MMVLITFSFIHDMGPWSPSSHLTITVDPTGIEMKFLETSLSVIFGLSFYYHFVMFFLIIYTNWWSINYWHCASDWAVEHHSCGAGESLSQWGHLYLQQGYVWIIPGIKSISLVCTLQILYMPLLVHYSDGGKMMRMFTLCLGFCRRS